MFRDREATAAPRLATLAVNGGRPRGPGDPLNQPPVFASAFRTGAPTGYGRESNPGWEAFEEALGALDGGTAVAFGSGMAAAAAVIESLPAGSRAVIGSTSYVEVRQLLRERSDLGLLELEEVDALDEAAVDAALAGADLLWLDALTNPMLEVPRLDRILPRATARGALCVVDATLVTPMLMRPLALGADLVVHSASKHLGGHSDLVLGAVVAADPRRADRLRHRRAATGAVPGSMEAWLALRGMRTLALRMRCSGANAHHLARRLHARGDVNAIHYPHLVDDPSFAAAGDLLDGRSAVISFDLGGADRADAVCEAVAVIVHAGSLGGVETVIERQARWHAEACVAPGLLRLSVGCEDPEDLWADLDRALSAAG